MTDISRLGYYGKIPANGDFITRRLPRSFIAPWDQWLQDCIAASREQLGNHWLNAYLVSPIWRFALSTGICNDHAWVGLIMPSVDRVSRHFPLTLVFPLTTNHTLFSIAAQEEKWFSQLEQVALHALDKNVTLESFNQSVDALDLPSGLECTSNAKSNINTPPDSNGIFKWRSGITSTHNLDGGFRLLAEQLTNDKLSNFCLWWTNGSEQVAPSLVVCENLPSATSFAALLDGDWCRWGWHNCLTKMSLPSSTVSAS